MNSFMRAMRSLLVCTARDNDVTQGNRRERQACYCFAQHSTALRGARLTSSTPLTRLTFAPTNPAKQAAHIPIAEAGDVQRYLRAVESDIVDLVNIYFRFKDTFKVRKALYLMNIIG